MRGELISKKTRNEFREFLVGWTLREIEMLFEAADVACDRQYDPQLGGQRRSFVEQHYRTLDFTKPTDVHKLLSAYEDVLNTAIRNINTHYDKEAAKRTIKGLVLCLKKDGFKYHDGRITPITPETRKIFEEAHSDKSISEITRRNIFDAIRDEDIEWWGRLSEREFLSRLYDLSSLPSHDHRFSSASEDIWQHRENNPEDWPDDWIFTDSRFDLLHSSDEDFLRFLCEMVHPVVRTDTQEVERLVTMFNQHLSNDGWEIGPRTQISRRPVFAARRLIVGGIPTPGLVKSLVEKLSAQYVTQQITRMEAAVESDPELAIGTAKELVETICKTILRECGVAVSTNVDLPQLVKQVRDQLDLLPEEIPEKAKGAKMIKRVLSNLGTIAQGLAELRGLYGSGHGKHAKVKGLQPRHARLAVGAAATLAVFLFETYQVRRGSN